jgi:hypothetical protein
MLISARRFRCDRGDGCDCEYERRGTANTFYSQSQ